MESERFVKGKCYLLSDVAGDSLKNEPAMYLGTMDASSDMISVCIICGKPLIRQSYPVFRLGIKGAKYVDAMVGHDCIVDRVESKPIETPPGVSMKNSFLDILSKYPDSGSWYGTFFHMRIAKRYVEDAKIREKWSPAIMSLPGVRFAIDKIDWLRSQGYTLYAEVATHGKRADLYGQHPDNHGIVMDWKTDSNHDKHAEYAEQVGEYIRFLSEDHGYIPVTGYVAYVFEGELVKIGTVCEKGEEKDANEGNILPSGSHRGSRKWRCDLSIDANGGKGLVCGTYAYSEKTSWGRQVMFQLPPMSPTKKGLMFAGLQCPPFSENETEMRVIDACDVATGVTIGFAVNPDRRKFKARALWMKNAGTTLDSFENKKEKEENDYFLEDYEYYSQWVESDEEIADIIASEHFVTDRIYTAHGHKYLILNRSNEIRQDARGNAIGSVIILEVDGNGVGKGDSFRATVYDGNRGEMFVDYRSGEDRFKVYARSLIKDLFLPGWQPPHKRND